MLSDNERVGNPPYAAQPNSGRGRTAIIAGLQGIKHVNAIGFLGSLGLCLTMTEDRLALTILVPVPCACCLAKGPIANYIKKTS